jgi:predicted nucleotidyltransferase
MRSDSDSHPSRFTDLNELLGQFVARVERILGDNFLGAYLQGSLALGDADMYSDCDFLIVIRNL